MPTGPLSGALRATAQRMVDDATVQSALEGVLRAWAAAVNDRLPEGQPAQSAGPQAGDQGPPLKGRATYEIASPRVGYLVIPSPGGYLIRGTAAHGVRPTPGRTGRGGRPAALRFQAGGATLYRRAVQIPARPGRTDIVVDAWTSAEVQAALDAVPGVLMRGTS